MTGLLLLGLLMVAVLEAVALHYSTRAVDAFAESVAGQARIIAAQAATISDLEIVASSQRATIRALLDGDDE